MKLIILILSTSLTLLYSMPSKNVSIINTTQKEFINEDCISTNSCNLTRTAIKIENKKVTLQAGENFLTKLTATYETNSIELVENYGFVNFIKGCHFTSKLQEGKIYKYHDYAHYHFNDIVTLYHPNFVIDSPDLDPFYGSSDNYERHYFYKWINNNNEINYYGEEKPENPSLFINYIPGTAFYAHNEAKNISLQFKTCIFKTKDIPYETNPNNIYFAKPIYCFNWNSSFIYNHQKEIYETKNTLDPFCL